MRGINKVIVMGHLGHNPELKTTAKGVVVCELAIATNRSRREGDEWVEETEWHNVTLWDQRAELARRFLSKGSPVFIEGRLKTESWEDRQTGQKRYKTVIIGEQVQLIAGRPPRRDEGLPLREDPMAGRDPLATSEHAPSLSEDEIPF